MSLLNGIQALHFLARFCYGTTFKNNAQKTRHQQQPPQTSTLKTLFKIQTSVLSKPQLPWFIQNYVANLKSFSLGEVPVCMYSAPPKRCFPLQNDLLFLKVTSQLHHLSIKCAIHVLHVNGFNPHCLRRRPLEEVGEHLNKLEALITWFQPKGTAN